MALLETSLAALTLYHRSKVDAKEAKWAQQRAAIRAAGAQYQAMEQLSNSQREQKLRSVLPSNGTLEASIRAAVRSCTREESDAVIAAVFRYYRDHPFEAVWVAGIRSSLGWFVDGVSSGEIPTICAEAYFEHVAEASGPEALKDPNTIQRLERIEDAAAEILLNMNGYLTGYQLAYFSMTYNKKEVEEYERLFEVSPE